MSAAFLRSSAATSETASTSSSPTKGASLIVYPARRGDGGTIFPPVVSSYRSEAVIPPPSIALTPEHYNRVVRLVREEIPVSLEAEVRAQFHDETTDSINVVAEIPGRSKPDELVLIGAHLDSVYAGGTGATDNAAGSAVMMEVMRILKTLELPMDRTVRMVLWGGEEEGLLGSRAYIKKHFGNLESMELTPEHAKVSAYYNFDNGTGRIRGVYLQENDMVRPIFGSWLQPFRDLGAATLASRRTGGSDHMSFDMIGIPGFQFIQDPVEYFARTWHSNMDLYERVQPRRSHAGLGHRRLVRLPHRQPRRAPAAQTPPRPLARGDARKGLEDGIRSGLEWQAEPASQSEETQAGLIGMWRGGAAPEFTAGPPATRRCRRHPPPAASRPASRSRPPAARKPSSPPRWR